MLANQVKIPTSHQQGKLERIDHNLSTPVYQRRSSSKSSISNSKIRCQTRVTTRLSRHVIRFIAEDNHHYRGHAIDGCQDPERSAPICSGPNVSCDRGTEKGSDEECGAPIKSVSMTSLIKLTVRPYQMLIIRGHSILVSTSHPYSKRHLPSAVYIS